jgi:DNA helicase-2/ATP-dependent DNA helicase PcrA
LENGEWEHLRPRASAGMFFNDIKNLISLLKREAITPEDFLASIVFDIEKISNDPLSISSRGETKGQLKKEIIKQIEGLERTKEIVEFYKRYEQIKKERALLDYDDVLSYALEIIKTSENAQATLKERYLYVLVDEHQDSSGIQNAILKAIWGDVELPNIFVVGDDRQLIYGFGGATIEYFEEFKTFFGKAKLISLVENYRSTQKILDAADTLLSSTLTLEKLKSNHKEMHEIELVECAYPRDEIIACALEIEKKIKDGVDPNDCAILVPKNYQVKNAVQILRDRGVPVASSDILKLFETKEAETLINTLSIVDDPYNAKALANSLFDPVLNIPPLKAHSFLHEVNTYKLSITDFKKDKQTLFSDGPIDNWGIKLQEYIEKSGTKDVYELIQYIGEDLLLNETKDHETLIRRIEVLRTMLHLALSEREKSERENKPFALKRFLSFIERLKTYDEDISLAVFGGANGVKVLTLHSSKGLEFDFVWVAHMDENTLMRGRRQAFTLPEDVSNKIEEKNEMVVKRQLYVALTRAKRFCTFSFSLSNYGGGAQELAHILQELPVSIFVKKTHKEIEEEIVKNNPKAYVVSGKHALPPFSLKDLTSLVAEEYQKTKVSVTMLNNFFECPWKWYFRNLLRMPDVLTESLIFGNVVHATIEQILKNNKTKLEEIILEQIHKQNIYEENLIKRIGKQAKSVVSAWILNRLPEIEKDYMSERSLSYRDSNFPNLLFYGKIDLTEKIKENSFRVTDFKTGSVKTKSEIEKIDENNKMSTYMRQLAMYSYLIGGAERNSQVVESQLEFLEAKENDKNKIYKTTIDKNKIDLLLKDIKEYDEELKNGEWLNRPCNFKTYGKDTECPNCKLAKIYK